MSVIYQSCRMYFHAILLALSLVAWAMLWTYFNEQPPQYEVGKERQSSVSELGFETA